MKRAIWMTAKGSELEVKRPDGGDLGITDLQSMVGGYIELWPMRVKYGGKQCQMAVNLFAEAEELILNVEASKLVYGALVLGNAAILVDGDLQ